MDKEQQETLRRILAGGQPEELPVRREETMGERGVRRIFWRFAILFVLLLAGVSPETGGLAGMTLVIVWVLEWLLRRR